MSDQGYLLAVQLVRRCMVGAVLWLGVPCATWIWLSRSSTGRRKHCPLGNSPSAEKANVLVSRVCTLLYYAAERGVRFIVENPASSMVALHPVFAQLCQLLGVDLIGLDLGAYGADSLKRLRLWGTCQFLPLMHKRCSALQRKHLKGRKQLVTSETDALGSVRVTGGKDLTDSQAYPEAFGVCFAKAFGEHWRKH